jgi:PhnB protein
MLIPSIHFQGNCDEAISFYKEVFGAEANEVFYAKDAPADSGMESLPPNFVMHSEVFICGTNFSLTDGSEQPITGDHISFMISFDTKEEVKAAYDKLQVDGRIVDPLAPTFWSDLYGYVVDRFGVNWQVMVKRS